MDLLIFILEILPIFLGVSAVLLTSRMYLKVRRKIDRTINVLGGMSAMLMIVAQTSWISTKYILQSETPTQFSSVMWLIFNSITMITIILYAIPRKRVNAKRSIPE